jgi:hypothetical protein
MADAIDKGKIISVIRVIEYRGTQEWVSMVLNASRAPVQGIFRGFPGQPAFPPNHEIVSGLVNFSDASAIEDQTSPEPSPPIPIPPPSSKIL